MKSFDLQIEPIDKGVFPTAKPSLVQLARKYREGRALVAERQNPDGTLTNVFIMSPKTRVKVGAVYTVGNFKNHRPYGDHLVVDVVDFKMKNGMLHIVDAAIGTETYSTLADITAVVFMQRA